jgi:MFS family permease
VPSALTVLTRNRSFRRLFIAELVLFGGDWFVLIPLLTLLPKLTGSGLWGGLVLSVDMALQALLLPYTGTVADRVDRRRIMLVANLVSLVAVALLLVVRSGGLAWVALVAVGAYAAAKSFFTPASLAALPNVASGDELVAANALSGSAWGTMLVVGASLGGVVSAAFGPYVCFLVTLGCLLLSAWLISGVRQPLQETRPPGPVPRAFAAVIEALRYIGRQPRVAALVTVKSAVGLGNGVLVAFPLLATQVYHRSELGTGLLFAARGAGALIGPFVLRWVLVRRQWLLSGLAASMVTYGLGYLGVAATPWLAVALPLVLVAHVGGGGNWMMSNYALQAEVPDVLRGRVFATDMMIATLAVAASQLVAGLFVDHVSPRAVVAACGAVTVLYAIGWRVVTWRLMRAAGPRSSAAGPSAAAPRPGDDPPEVTLASLDR